MKAGAIESDSMKSQADTKTSSRSRQSLGRELVAMRGVDSVPISLIILNLHIHSPFHSLHMYYSLLGRHPGSS